MKKIYVGLLFLCVFSSLALAADNRRLETNITVDWIDTHRFDVISEGVSRRFDCQEVNVSNYNAYDRVWAVDIWRDLEGLRTCSEGTINNITDTVNKLVNHCSNYQQYINGTVQFADKYAEWMAEAARVKQALREEEERCDNTQSNLNSTAQQLSGCIIDKQSYLTDWQEADKKYSTCSTDLSSAKGSFGSKYLIGAVIGGVLVFIFTRKNEGVAEESEEFDTQEY